MEIPVEVTVRMETSSKSIEAIKRFKQLVEQHYIEPLMDSLKTVPKRSRSSRSKPGEEIASSRDEDDQDITSEK